MCIAPSGGSVWDLIDVNECKVIQALRGVLGHVDDALLVREGLCVDPHYVVAAFVSRAELVRALVADSGSVLSAGDIEAVLHGWETGTIVNTRDLDELEFPARCAPRDAGGGYGWGADASAAGRAVDLRGCHAAANDGWKPRRGG